MACLKQWRLSKLIDDFSFSTLLAGASDWNRARLLSVSSPGAGAWLGVVPSSALRQTLDPKEFSTLLRFWTGQSLFTESTDCPMCDTHMELFGFHALTCRSGGGLGVRHNALRDAFFYFVQRCGIVGVGRETAYLLSGSADRPADVLIPPSCLVIPGLIPSKPVCLDFAVTNPQQSSRLSRASVSAGAAAADYESKVKLPRYLDECRANGLGFVPMVVETFGAWGPAAIPVLDQISRAGASAKALEPELVGKYLRQTLSFTLQRLNAQILLKFISPTTEDLEDPIPIFVASPSCSDQDPLSPSSPRSASEDRSFAVDWILDHVSLAPGESPPPAPLPPISPPTPLSLPSSSSLPQSLPPTSPNGVLLTPTSLSPSAPKPVVSIGPQFTDSQSCPPVSCQRGHYRGTSFAVSRVNSNATRREIPISSSASSSSPSSFPLTANIMPSPVDSPGKVVDNPPSYNPSLSTTSIQASRAFCTPVTAELEGSPARDACPGHRLVQDGRKPCMFQKESIVCSP